MLRSKQVEKLWNLSYFYKFFDSFRWTVVKMAEAGVQDSDGSDFEVDYMSENDENTDENNNFRPK